MSLEFNWKYKDYELRAHSSCLVKFDEEDKNETIDLVKWVTKSDGTRYCYSLAYWVKDSESYYLKFVGNRAFNGISEDDLPYVWKAIKTAQTVLDIFFDDLEVEK